MTITTMTTVEAKKKKKTKNNQTTASSITTGDIDSNSNSNNNNNNNNNDSNNKTQTDNNDHTNNDINNNIKKKKKKKKQKNYPHDGNDRDDDRKFRRDVQISSLSSSGNELTVQRSNNKTTTATTTMDHKDEKKNKKKDEDELDGRRSDGDRDRGSSGFGDGGDNHINIVNATTTTTTTTTTKKKQRETTMKKNKKKKAPNPFRVKIGCLAAIRYRSKGNHILLEQQQQQQHRRRDRERQNGDVDGDNDDDSNDRMEKESSQVTPQLFCGDFTRESGLLGSALITKRINKNKNDDDDDNSNSNGLSLSSSLSSSSIRTLPDPVTAVQFCEMWTDPRAGRDDGLALIGSRIRVMYSKASLRDYPTSSTGRMVEGEVISIVDYRTQFDEMRKAHRNRQAYPLLVEMLVDNRDNGKRLSSTMTHLPRVDNPPLTETQLNQLKESERRSYQNEQRIKGEGRAIVRVLLCDVSGLVTTTGVTSSRYSLAVGLPEGRWVVRRRVATKIVRRGNPAATDSTTASSDSRGNTDDHSAGAAAASPSSEKTKSVEIDDEGRAGGAGSGPTRPKKRRVNKDFLVSRYLGDGNDDERQQEANWRWQVSKSFNPHDILGTERPISMELLERCCYNFVGEVVGIHPMPISAFARSKAKSQPTTSSTLAMVSLRVLILPEHTRGGRLPEQDPLEVFECNDICSEDFGCNDESSSKGESRNSSKLYIRVPVEELLVVSREVNQMKRYSYSFRMDCFDSQEVEGMLLQPVQSKESLLEQQSLTNLSKQVIRSISQLGATLDDLGDYTKREGLIATRFVTKGMTRVDFAFSVLTSSWINESSARVITKTPSRTPKRMKKIGKSGVGKATARSPSGRKSPKSMNETTPSDSRLPPPPKDDSFRPTSSRLLPYNVKKRKFNVAASELFQWRLYRPVSADFPERPRSLRNNAAVPTSVPTTTGRAARVKQRRVQRSFTRFGGGIDTLAGRETQLRFDRSTIHDWGVFVDVDVKKGEMIVEYRGELISNTMAEKREKEYHEAKLPDYMFRIDDFIVCDATRQGNVARFINASCDPNCYTKIITLDNTKRIVIYAKKDIPAGTELCYDYKFEIESDPEKRIPCGCGSANCRGFLN